ncbi:MAG: polysaccharide deacetylase family protein [Xanthobacteraceae bacterium]|nr:polysaccharide deacetylase family protein [Xanthobacteraceae bacterium]
MKYRRGGTSRLEGGGTVDGALRELALQLAYFSGTARIVAAYRGGAGVILRFERVRPARGDAFQPLQRSEITPERFDRLCGALPRWGLEVVTLDEALRRTLEPAKRQRRYAVLTFDGAYRDVATHAAAVLARHRHPYTIFVPTGFVDGIAPMWWLALEQVILRHDRLSLVVAGTERHFDVGGTRQKYEVFAFLDGWMRTLAPQDQLNAAHDLCRRYSVDMTALSRAAAMEWSDLRALARDPLVEIGSATVHHPVLTTLPAAAALREMRMGRQVAEAALDRAVRHFAYPFGGRETIGRRDVGHAQDAGFASAVTTEPRVVRPRDAAAPYALPRLSWDGRRRSLRGFRVLTAGIGGAGAEG